MFKTKKIILSPTKNYSQILLVGKWNRLYYKLIEGDVIFGRQEFDEDESCQDLYVVSDEHIEIADFIYDESTKSLVLIKTEEDADFANACNYRWKVIATTVKLLGVPLIKDEIIKQYIDLYNDDSQIHTVDVEYDQMWYNKRFGGIWQPFPDEQAKLSKHTQRVYYDGYASIAPIKMTWTREEALELAKNGYDCGHSDARISLGSVYDQEGFINSNF